MNITVFASSGQSSFKIYFLFDQLLRWRFFFQSLLWLIFYLYWKKQTILITFYHLTAKLEAFVV